MTLPQNLGIPESLEAAKALRIQKENDEEIDALYNDPDYVEEMRVKNLANSPYGAYRPYSLRYEADIALNAMGFDEIGADGEQHDERGDIYLQNVEGQESFPGNPDVKDGEYSPFVDRFGQQLGLSISDIAVIKEELFHNSENPELILTNPKLPEGAQRIIEGIQDLNSPETSEQNAQNFDSDFADELSAFSTNGEFEGLSEEVYNAISTKYFRFEEKTPEALDMAFEMGLNTYIKDITPDTREVELQNLIDTVRDGDIDFSERFIAFTHILESIHTEHGAKGGRRKLDITMRQQREQLRNAGLEERFNEAQQQLRLAQQEGNSKAILQAQARIEELSEQSAIGDIGANWDLDLETGGIEGSGNENT